MFAKRWLFLVVLGVVSLGYALLEGFSRFAPYDDEGYLLMTVRHFLDGKKLYGDIQTVYGPFYFVWKWFVHGVLGFPLSNHAARLTGTFLWIGTSLALARVSWRLTAKPWLSVLTYVASVCYLWVFSSEPGHPHETATFAIALFLVAVTEWDGKSGRWLPVWAGVTGGALLMTKINLGVFFLLPVLLCGCPGRTRGRFFQCVRMLVLFAILTLPLAVAARQLADPYVVVFCGLMGSSALLLFQFSNRAEYGLGGRDLGWFSIGLVGTILGAAGFALYFGASSWGLVDGLILAPARLAGSFKLPLPFPKSALLGLISSLFLFALHQRRGRTIGGLSGATLETVFAVLKGGCAMWLIAYLMSGSINGGGGSRVVIKWAIPFLWLGATRYPAAGLSEGVGLGRLLICHVPLLLPFQAFPVAGSQCGIGTLFFLPIAILCLNDCADWALGRLKSPRQTERVGAVVGASVQALAIVVLAVHLGRVGIRYRQGVSIGEPGADWIRIGAREVARMKWVLTNVRAGSDTFFCPTGLNSLHLWAGRPPVTSIVIGNSLDIFSSEQKELFVKGLEGHADVLIVVDRQSIVNWLGKSVPENIVESYIRKEFRICGSYDGFEVMARQGRPCPAVGTPGSGL